MSYKTTLILTVLLAACVGLVFLLHSDWVGRDRSTDIEQAEGPLLPESGNIVSLKLQGGDQVKMAFRRENDKWRMLRPVVWEATQWQVESSVRILTNLSYKLKYAPGDADFPKDDLTHLSEPLRTAVLGNDEDKTFTVKVGKNPPMSPGQTYVQLDGDEHVYVVDRNLLEALDKKVSDYREPTVVKFDPGQAVRVEVAGSRNFELVKSDGRWAIEKPVSALADQDKVADLLRSAGEIEAAAFVEDKPESLAPYGLDQPHLTLTVELAPPTPTTSPTAQTTAPAEAKRGKMISIAFGPVAEKGQTVFAKLAGAPGVFRVSDSKLKDLQPELSDLWDKHVLAIAGKEAKGIEIKLTAGTSATLEKTDDGWRMLSPHQGPCNGESVEKLLSALRDMKAGEFNDNPASLAAFGLDEPVGRIALSFRGSDRSETLLLGRSSESGQVGFVQPAGSRWVAVVSSADYSVLLRPAPAYWNNRFFKLPEGGRISRVELVRPEGRFVLLSDAEGKLTLDEPVKAPADEENAEALIVSLADLKADNVISLSQTLPKRFADLKPVEVAVTYVELEEIPAPAHQLASASGPASAPASAPAPQTREVVAAAPILLVVDDAGKSYVWRKDASPVAVGQLPGSFYGKLTAELRDRQVLMFDPDQAVSFSVTLAGKSPLEMVKAGDDWRYSTDRFVKVDAAKVLGFLKDLSEMKALRFAEYGDKPDPARYGLDAPAAEISVTCQSGQTSRLSISRAGPAGTVGHYAISSEAPGVFVLAPGADMRISPAVTDFQKD